MLSIDDVRAQLKNYERDLTETENRMNQLLLEIQKLRGRQLHLREVISGLKGLLREDEPELSLISVNRETGDRTVRSIPAVKTVRIRQRHSPKSVMIDALRRSGRPMTATELWAIAKAAGFETKQHPQDAANYALYAARSKNDEPIDRLQSGEWVWRGAGIARDDERPGEQGE